MTDSANLAGRNHEEISEFIAVVVQINASDDLAQSHWTGLISCLIGYKVPSENSPLIARNREI
jgi:hypothetical protein